MKAALFRRHGGPDVIEIAELPDPEPGPGEVRVAVEACGLNRLDIFVRRGIPGLAIPLPHVGGSDIAGSVESVGPDIEAWRAGDRVAVNPSLWCGRCEHCLAGQQSLCERFRILGEHVHGGFAELVVVPASHLVALPPEIDAAQAAAVPLSFQTAWRALFGRARLRAGETVLILGASGGTAVAAVQMAKLAGAVVYAVTSGAENARRVHELGADFVIDRTQGDFSAEVWRLTGKRGVDVVLENAGAATWAASLRALRRGGRLVTYGATTGNVAETNLALVFWKQMTLMGTTMGSHREFREAMEIFLQGRVRPVISHVLPLVELARGHEVLERGQQFGKVVVRVARS